MEHIGTKVTYQTQDEYGNIVSGQGVVVGHAQDAKGNWNQNLVWRQSPNPYGYDPHAGRIIKTDKVKSRY